MYDKAVPFRLELLRWAAANYSVMISVGDIKRSATGKNFTERGETTAAKVC